MQKKQRDETQLTYKYIDQLFFLFFFFKLTVSPLENRSVLLPALLKHKENLNIFQKSISRHARKA